MAGWQGRGDVRWALVAEGIVSWPRRRRRLVVRLRPRTRSSRLEGLIVNETLVDLRLFGPRWR